MSDPNQLHNINKRRNGNSKGNLQNIVDLTNNGVMNTVWDMYELFWVKFNILSRFILNCIFFL